MRCRYLAMQFQDHATKRAFSENLALFHHRDRCTLLQQLVHLIYPTLWVDPNINTSGVQIKVVLSLPLPSRKEVSHSHLIRREVKCVFHKVSRLKDTCTNMNCVLSQNCLWVCLTSAKLYLSTFMLKVLEDRALPFPATPLSPLYNYKACGIFFLNSFLKRMMLNTSNIGEIYEIFEPWKIPPLVA